MRHCGPARAPSRFCPSDGQQEVGIRRQEAQFQSSRRYPKDLFGLPAARLWTTWGRSTRSLVIVTVATSLAVEFISSATSCTGASAVAPTYHWNNHAGGEYACRSVRAHQCSEADTAIQTNPVLGGISARIHWLYRTLDLAAAMQLSGPGAAGLGCRPNHGAAV